MRDETKEGTFAERVRGEATRPPIRLDELDAAERQAAPLQAAGVAYVQRVLDALRGGRADSAADGKAITDRVRGLAEALGVRLEYGGRPVYLKWHGAAFKLTRADRTRAHIDSSRTFPALTAHPLQLVEDLSPPSADTHGRSGR